MTADTTPREMAAEKLERIIKFDRREQRKTTEVDPAGNTYEVWEVDGPCATLAREALAALQSEPPPVDRNAVLEEAAKVAEDYDGKGYGPQEGYFAQLGDAGLTMRDIATAIRALKTAPPSPDPAIRKPKEDEGK